MVPTRGGASRRARSMAAERRTSGFTLVELLVTSVVFLIVLAAVGSLLVSATRAYRVTADRSEAIQDTEAVMQLLRQEVGMAGYRGLAADRYDQAFTLGDDDTIEVVRTDAGDEITVRYFEDRYLATGDTGEREVTFSVDPAENALVRAETRPGGGGTTELLVGSVAGMTVTSIVDVARERVSVTDILSGAEAAPDEIAGLTTLVRFTDGQEWEFLVGTTNPQLYSVSSR